MNNNKCIKGHFTDKEHDGKKCPYDDMSASKLASALAIDTEQKEREKYQEVMSGAISSGALDSEGKDKDRADKHAEVLYETFRNSKYDVVKISKLSGFTKEDISKIKKYLFENPEFYPNFYIAQSWDRLRKGIPIEEDFLLLKHELYEMQIKENNPNISHDEAHDEAEKVYNYAKAIKEWENDIFKKKRNNKK